MALIEVHQEVPKAESYNAERVRSLFNVDAEKGQRFDLITDLPVEDRDWSIGVVVGPSGSGKTSIGRALDRAGFRFYTEHWVEPEMGDACLVDQLDNACGTPGFDAVTGALSQVGLGSVPSWLRPYKVLSNGEQFRAQLARLVLDPLADRVIVDEFTSVLDRQIARVGAMAFAKSWRRGGRQVILLTPHHDVIEWLQPDWVLDTGIGDGHLVVGSESVHLYLRGTSEDPAGRTRGWVGLVEA